MSVLTNHFYRATGWLNPTSYVETGTFKGKNLEKVVAAGHYKSIHSIELSEECYTFNQAKFSDSPIVQMHNGDSAQVMKSIISKLELPIQFFLDAHYSGPGTAHGKLETPLLEELGTIAKANLSGNNVIVIDDCRMLGKRGMARGGGDYQAFESDWSEITEKHILQIVGTGYIKLHNNLNHWTYGKEDQIILLKLDGIRAFSIILEDKIVRLVAHIRTSKNYMSKIIKNLIQRMRKD